MKLIGTKEKGYQLVSSFAQTKPGKPGKQTGVPEKNTPSDGGTTYPNQGRKES